MRVEIKLAGIAFWCCLLAAAPGCSFHRTNHGFVMGSQWSLEYRHVPWLSFRANQYADMPQAGDGAKMADSGKPELLPWRNRLRGYRLGSRLFHGKEQSEGEITASVSVEPLDKQLIMPPPAPMAKLTEGAVSSESKKPMPKAVEEAKEAEIRIPDREELPVASKPRMPDIVVD